MEKVKIVEGKSGNEREFEGVVAGEGKREGRRSEKRGREKNKKWSGKVRVGCWAKKNKKKQGTEKKRGK